MHDGMFDQVCGRKFRAGYACGYYGEYSVSEIDFDAYDPESDGLNEVFVYTDGDLENTVWNSTNDRQFIDLFESVPVKEAFLLELRRQMDAGEIMADVVDEAKRWYFSENPSYDVHGEIDTNGAKTGLELYLKHRDMARKSKDFNAYVLMCEAFGIEPEFDEGDFERLNTDKPR